MSGMDSAQSSTQDTSSLSIYLLGLPLVLFLIVAFTLRPFPPTDDVMDMALDPLAMQIALRAYYESMTNHQYCALAVLIAVVIHFNINAQFGAVILVPQALGVLGATTALASMFLIHLMMHSLAFVACDMRSTVRFNENLLQVPQDAWINIPRVFGAPKRMVALSSIFFVAYRAADIFSSSLPSSPTQVDAGTLFSTLLTITVATALVFVAVYCAMMTRAFLRLVKPASQTTVPVTIVH